MIRCLALLLALSGCIDRTERKDLRSPGGGGGSGDASEGSAGDGSSDGVASDGGTDVGTGSGAGAGAGSSTGSASGPGIPETEKPLEELVGIGVFELKNAECASGALEKPVRPVRLFVDSKQSGGSRFERQLDGSCLATQKLASAHGTRGRLVLSYEAGKCEGACPDRCPSQIFGVEGTNENFALSLQSYGINSFSMSGGTSANTDVCGGAAPARWIFARTSVSGLGGANCPTRWTKRGIATDAPHVAEGELRWSTAKLAANEKRELVGPTLAGDFAVTIAVRDFTAGGAGAVVGLKIESLDKPGAFAAARFGTWTSVLADSDVLVAAMSGDAEYADDTHASIGARKTGTGTLRIERLGDAFIATARTDSASAERKSKTVGTAMPGGAYRIVLELGNTRDKALEAAETAASFTGLQVSDGVGTPLESSDGFDCDSVAE